MKHDTESKHFSPLFDKKGKAAFYIDQDSIHVFGWDGEPVGFIEKGVVYNFKAEVLGFFDNGWLRDSSGKCVAFAEAGKGGPNPPKTKPPATPPAEKKEAPELPEISESPARPPRKAAWSDVSPADFFKK